MSYTLRLLARAKSRASRLTVYLASAFTAILLAPGPAQAALDLQQAHVQRLDNGLTVVVLEDRGFPAVSVQMLYRAGGRDEQYGKTGLAHFLEHMAFRATEDFPDTDVVSRIYAAGGEWHGYTWIDQTTYFETVPVEELDTVLRIEADRMARLKIPESELEPERGAVLAEMHGYENDPASVLHDQLVFTAFQGHPYRNNVIGLESDIERVELADIRAFYQEHYHPGNAVLAIVGDVNTSVVMAWVEELFGGFPATRATPLPRTVEAPQQGLRRISLVGPGPESLFEIAYQAPSARSEDFPAFLVLREVLAGSGGINFHQDSGRASVRAGTLLSGVTDDLRSWYPVSAQTYLFFLSGSVGEGQSRADLERRLEERIAGLRSRPVSAEVLSRAVVSLKRELVFDLQTTEDAAHQLAYFDGLGALEVLLGLEEAIDKVSASDIQRVAGRYFQPFQRTIGWTLPGTASTGESPGIELPRQFGLKREPTGTGPATVISVPAINTLSGGLPVIWQRATASPTVNIQILLNGEAWEAPSMLSTGYPEPGFSSLEHQFLATKLEEGLDALAAELHALDQSPVSAPEGIQDPASRLEAILRVRVGGTNPDGNGSPQPLAIVVSGDVDRDRLLAGLEDRFGKTVPGITDASSVAGTPGKTIVSSLSHPVAQAQLGYAVRAPSLATAESAPWRVLLYILSHGYEGRLGKEAISRRGLIYYIDSNYASDSGHGLVSLAIGVDPSKLEPMKELLHAQLQGLLSEPPTEDEVNEAKQNFLGRYLTAYQSNEERTSYMARQWIQHGRLLNPEEILDTVEGITREQVLATVPSFLEGTTVVVNYSGTDQP